MTAKKLPRRTKSMANRAVKAAKEVADLDMVENAIGPTGGHTNVQVLLGFVFAIIGIVVFMGAFSLLFGAGDTDYAMLAPGYREEVGLAVPSNGNATLTTNAQGSPFPRAQTDTPIIVEVGCPPGTVRISTGKGAVNTLCVRGQLEGAVPPDPIVVVIQAPAANPSAAEAPLAPPEAMLAPSSDDTGKRILATAGGPNGEIVNGQHCHEEKGADNGILFCEAPSGDGPPTVGGTEVPDGMRCHEDEAITFDGLPNTLFCVQQTPNWR